MFTVRYVVVLDGLCSSITDSATKTSLFAWLPEPAAADQSMDSSAKTPCEIVLEAEMDLRLLLIQHFLTSPSEDIHRAKHHL